MLKSKRYQDTDIFESKLFENRGNLMRPHEVAFEMGLSTRTIYNWNYYGAKRGVPKKLFLKVNGRLFVRVDVLRDWIARQNL